MLAVDLSDAAAELYRELTGQPLAAVERATLSQLLAQDADGHWISRRHVVDSRAALEARALAGLFLLDEDVIWSSRYAHSSTDTFRRMRHLIAGAKALEEQIADTRRANGEQRITLRSGRRLLFRIGVLRGATADLYILAERGGYRDDPEPHVWPALIGRPNPQLIVRG
jgi:hypothetical protein